MAKEATDMTGHNSMELSDAERKSLFMHHFRGVLAQSNRMEVERVEYKRLRKLAKADGIQLRDLDYAIRVNDTEDVGLIREEAIRHAEIMVWMGLPPGTQADFDFDREPVNDRAKREGAAAGYAGKDRSPPFAIDSKPAQIWLKHYDAARAQADKDFETAAAKVAALRDSETEGEADDEVDAEHETETEDA